MVLFYDDDRYAPKPPVTGWRKYLRRLIKVIVIIAVLLIITMWVLSTAGGNSKALKLGIQDYLTDATGYLAELKTLNSMQFFPVTHIQFSELTLHRPVMKQRTAAQIADEEERRKNDGEMPQLKGVSDFYDAGETVARIADADVRMNFWDMFFSRRRFYALDVKDVTIEEAVWLPRRLHLETLHVDQDKDSPAIVAQGQYGDHKLDIRIRTRRAADGAYEIPDVTQFQLHVGPLQAKGEIDASGNATRLKFNELSIGEHSFTGDLSMKGGFSGTVIKADLHTGRSTINADLKRGDDGLKGKITASTLDMQDVKVIQAAYNDLRSIWGGGDNNRISFGTLKADINLAADKLVRGETRTEWGHVKADLIVQPYLWQLNNISGLLGGGALKGSFAIDATGTGDAQLKADMNLRGWDYARLGADKNADVTGQADIYLRLQGAGKTFDVLKASTKGELVVVGGKGTLTADTALYNGAKILDTMLPGLPKDHDLTMHCLLGRFELSDTKATAKNLFMDLSDLTITGQGYIQLTDNVLDMKFTPELKKQSTLPRAGSVHVKGTDDESRILLTGSLSDKKSNGAIPGSIDAGLTLFSLTDIGIQEAHPCHAFIKKTE